MSDPNTDILNHAVQDPSGGESQLLQQLLTFRISRVNARLNAQALRILRRTTGLTLTQWRILVALDALGDSSLSRIVEATQMHKAMVSRTVKSMLQQGLLQTKRNPKDMRAHILGMTVAGRGQYDIARPAMRQRQIALRAAIGEDNVAGLLSALDLLDDHFDKLKVYDQI